MADLTPEDVGVVMCVEGGGVCFCDGDPFTETLGRVALLSLVNNETYRSAGMKKAI